MELDRALESFMSKRKRPYSQSDIQMIRDAVKSLKISDDFIVFKDYVTDPGHEIHIHSTMIVSSRSFPGSINRGIDPYRIHRFFVSLSAWRKRSSRYTQRQ